MKEIISFGVLEKKILLLRGHRVMLDRHLAELYMVETGALNRAVKRNKTGSLLTSCSGYQ